MNKQLASFCIKTSRLTLVLPSLRYKKALFSGLTQEVTTYMLSSPFRTVKRVKKFINHFRQWYLAGTDLLCLVIRKSDSKFLWCVWLHHLERTEPEFGIWFCARAHGKWYGIEAISTLFEYSKKHHQNVEYYKYPVDKRNSASIKIAEKLGWAITTEYPMTSKKWKELEVVEYRIEK